MTIWDFADLSVIIKKIKKLILGETVLFPVQKNWIKTDKHKHPNFEIDDVLNKVLEFKLDIDWLIEMLNIYLNVLWMIEIRFIQITWRFFFSKLRPPGLFKLILINWGHSDPKCANYYTKMDESIANYFSNNKAKNQYNYKKYTSMAYKIVCELKSQTRAMRHCQVIQAFKIEATFYSCLDLCKVDGLYILIIQ